jgi:hypothetical protein
MRAFLLNLKPGGSARDLRYRDRDTKVAKVSITKETHEVRQSRPGWTGLRHRTTRGHLIYRLQHSDGRVSVCGHHQADSGQMEVYEVNSESGVLRTIPTSPFPSGGRNPIAEAADASSENLYVANNDDNNIVQFGIGTDGKLYPQSTINTPGAFPSGPGSQRGSYVYVLDTLGPRRRMQSDQSLPRRNCRLCCHLSHDGRHCRVERPGVAGPGLRHDWLDGNCSNLHPREPGREQQWPGIRPAAAQRERSDSADADRDELSRPTAAFVYVSAYGASSGGDQGYLFAFSVGSDGSLTSLFHSGRNVLSSTGQATQMIPLPFGSQPVAMIERYRRAPDLYVADEAAEPGRYGFSLESSGVPSLASTAGYRKSASGADDFQRQVHLCRQLAGLHGDRVHDQLGRPVANLDLRRLHQPHCDCGRS